MLDKLINEPFLGFRPEALKFLKGLSQKKNNNKDWFDKHREIYEIYLKQPMKNLIDTLAVEIYKIDPEIIVNYKSIFRINRDIRFSKDKTPYKDYYSAAFAFKRVKSAEIPHFYFQFNNNEFLYAGGQYSMDNDNLKKIRKAIFKNFDEFRSIVTNKKFTKAYGGILGETLTRLPKGFENIDPKSDALLLKSLKLKQYYVVRRYNPEVVLSERLVDLLISEINLCYDFTKFLHNAINKNI